MQKQNPILRVWELGKTERPGLVRATLSAFLGVVGGMVPYFAAAQIIIHLLAGNRDLTLYLKWLCVGLAGYAARTLLYNLALSMSHKAAFSILKTIRQMVLAKLPRLPLGTVTDMPSGRMKQMIVDQVDSMETTLAHLFPELTANIAGPLLILSMVFQSVYLFADTIENNIKFGRPEATHTEVVEAARKACCDDFIESLPGGYNTVIGEGGATLSGGEKQRISIARAILKDAPIIILDEATANVDPENEDRLQKAIEELTRDKTIIMIAHRLKTVRNADQILVVDSGRIVQQGKHDELIGQKGIYADFVLGRKEAIGWKIRT